MMPSMGFRDRFKKGMKGVLGRSDGKPEKKTKPPPKVRSRAVYRTGTDRRIEGAEHMEQPPEPVAAPPEPEPEAEAEAAELAPAAAEAPEPEVAEPEPAETAESSQEPETETEEETFSVRLVNEHEGLDVTIQCYPEEFVLDAAERQAVDLPSSCRNGGCYVCAGKLVTGELTLGDQYVLEEEHIDEGFRLLCCGWVTSDATIITHQNDEIS